MKQCLWAVEVFDGKTWRHWTEFHSRSDARSEAKDLRRYQPVRVVKFVRAA